MGKKYELFVLPTETIFEIKTKIETELKLGEVKNLIYAGNVLESSDTLQSLGVFENAILIVLIKKKNKMNAKAKVTKEKSSTEKQDPAEGKITKKKLLETMRQKDEIEKKIAGLSLLGNDALYGSLVDKDGFPRSDVDVH